MPSSPARAVPLQSRSRERRARILDAAAHVFAEVGYEAATTEAVAERAATSIGSVYRFFPNKRALLDALIASYLEKSRALFARLLADDVLAMPWEDLVARGVDAYARFNETEPAFRAVFRTIHLTDQLLVEGEALNREFAKRLESVFMHHAPAMSPEDARVVSTFTVELVSAMLTVAAHRRKIGPRLLEETKKGLVAYLSAYLPPSPRGKRAAKRATV
jgi:AcrR family transcriptional regulator